MIFWHVLPIVVTSLIFRDEITQQPASSGFPTLSSDRRRFLEQSVLSSWGISTASLQPPAFAETGAISRGNVQDDESEPRVIDSSIDRISSSSYTKPFAPVSALLPATRGRLWIEKAHNISSGLASSTYSSTNDQELYETLQHLNDVLNDRPKLFVKGEKPLTRVSSVALAQLTAMSSLLPSSSATMTPSSTKDPFASSPSLAEKFSTALNRADVSRQWGILQTQESRKESQNELRAALNYYTQKLTRIDVSDVIDLMNQAHVALTKWFDMIDTKDIKEAEILVQNE
jgi:hypothetical protein